MIDNHNTFKLKSKHYCKKLKISGCGEKPVQSHLGRHCRKDSNTSQMLYWFSKNSYQNELIFKQLIIYTFIFHGYMYRLQNSLSSLETQRRSRVRNLILLAIKRCTKLQEQKLHGSDIRGDFIGQPDRNENPGINF